MRKADRLFEIIQRLRLAAKPVTAAQIAEEMEVSVRSIYRDIAALQAMRVPIAGDRGVGYILRPGFDLPPLMFTIEEVEAITLALDLLDRTGDSALLERAERVRAKIAGAIPAALRAPLAGETLRAWGFGARIPEGLDLDVVRAAIRDERKLALSYADAQGRPSQRTIWPLALIYYVDVAVIAAWCELRQDFRHFRVDRIAGCSLAEGGFKGKGDGLRAQWDATWKEVPRASA